MPNEGLVTDGWQVSTRLDQQIILGPNGSVLMPPMTFSGNARSAQSATVVRLGPGEDRPGMDLSLPLVTAVRITGVLTGPDGPAPNHGVQLIPASTGDPVYPFPVAYSITDAAGRFMLLSAEPGSYVVRARRVPPIGPIFIPAPPTAGAPSWKNDR